MPEPLFRIEMLPALHGDSLLLEYGNPAHPRRVLIDGGPIGAYPALESRINAMPAGDRRFELVVMTHVDADHVEGILRLFANSPLPINPQDVWFNGWRHISPAAGILGPTQGEFLSALLVRRLSSDRWNKAFGNKAVVVEDGGLLPEKALEGGLKLTLLSPTPATLEKMRQTWGKDIDPGIVPGDLDAAWKKLGTRKAFLPRQGLLGGSSLLDALIEKQLKIDESEANGSAIAFLAEIENKSCLFLADAHQDVITASLKRLLAKRKESILKVDAVKVAHHGSAGNVSDDLLALIDSPRFLFSTNGAKFNHPDAEAVQRVIAGSKVKPVGLYFNYLSDTTKPWQPLDRQHGLNYVAHYNPSEDKPFVIEL
ncbi:hypothetical protein KP005_05060 [Geomonas nitrogeniifigens]|uniref:MBL fold metallo-hydrolase n=1 Tax=Geomonas diazotrophica TaxID=2843197 RepID=A0ABX8JJV4_9BACT|nr:hypothetical protein [Geomonas nitrogeniifigens]QWV98659.1 hypothetical protein KP005_05060 [Geomonas nitrogeniifigens]